MKSLKSLLGNDFGRISDKNIVLTINGLGYKVDDQVNVLDKATKTITRVPAEFVLGDFPTFVLPVQDKDLKEGDLVIHNKFLKLYMGKNEDGTHKAINIKTNEVQTLVPVKTLLGFSAFAKVVSLIDGFGGVPAGTDGTINLQGLLPLMLLGGDGEGLFGGGDEGDGLEGLLLMSALGGGGNALGGLFGGAGAGNPLQTVMMLKMLKGL